MRSIALGLDLEENFFDAMINEQSHNLRLLSYPPIQKALLAGEDQARAGAHTGTISFTFVSCGLSQKMYARLWYFNIALPRLRKCMFNRSVHPYLLWQVGGLEVQNPHTGTFIPATPIVGPL
jgi:isopenicillin N synthase-like dioxygenase